MMRSPSRRFALLALLLAGCGAMREHVARERYLGQMLYDYVHERPLDEVWPEAMAVLGRSREEGRDAGGGRTWAGVVLLHPAAEAPAPVRIHAEALDGRRTRVAFLRDRPDGPEGRMLDPRDIDGRLWELELRLLQRLAPEDARRLEDGARRAAWQAAQ